MKTAVPAITISRLAEPFSWSSTGPLIHAVPNATHPILAVKDPTVVFFNNRWHVYATTSNGSAWSMMYINFPTFQQAAAAQPYYMDATPGFTGYHAAPVLAQFTVKVIDADAADHGGLATVRSAVPAAMSEAEIATFKWVASTKVVVLSFPFHRTTAPGTKFVPVTVT